MSENRKMTCIVCPIGCQIDVQLENGDIISLEGYTCPRGREYAGNEIRNPLRMVTSTVRVMGGELPMLPVKTSKPIPKNLIMECMNQINRVAVTAPVASGDAIIKDVLGTGADIVATRHIKKAS